MPWLVYFRGSIRILSQCPRSAHSNQYYFILHPFDQSATNFISLPFFCRITGGYRGGSVPMSLGPPALNNNNNNHSSKGVSQGTTFHTPLFLSPSLTANNVRCTLNYFSCMHVCVQTFPVSFLPSRVRGCIRADVYYTAIVIRTLTAHCTISLQSFRCSTHLQPT